VLAGALGQSGQRPGRRHVPAT
ncbi:hypothetical protein, partial [Mycobacterium tuberculosis]